MSYTVEAEVEQLRGVLREEHERVLELQRVRDGLEETLRGRDAQIETLRLELVAVMAERDAARVARKPLALVLGDPLPGLARALQAAGVSVVLPDVPRARRVVLEKLELGGLQADAFGVLRLVPPTEQPSAPVENSVDDVDSAPPSAAKEPPRCRARSPYDDLCGRDAGHDGAHHAYDPVEGDYEWDAPSAAKGDGRGAPCGVCMRPASAHGPDSAHPYVPRVEAALPVTTLEPEERCANCRGTGYETLEGTGGRAQGPCHVCRPAAAAGRPHCETPPEVCVPFVGDGPCSLCASPSQPASPSPAAEAAVAPPLYHLCASCGATATHQASFADGSSYPACDKPECQPEEDDRCVSCGHAEIHHNSPIANGCCEGEWERCGCREFRAASPAASGTGER